MRYVKIDNLQPNSKLAMEVYDSSGRILLEKNKFLTDERIDAMRRYGLDGVYIEDALTSDIQVETLVSAQLRGKGLQCVREQNIEACTYVAEEMVSQILGKDYICLELADLRSNDEFTYHHSVDVALYACAIGAGMHLSRKQLVELTTAGLLHDFGKIFIPPDILNKNGRLSPEEFQMMREHAFYSYEIIKNAEEISPEIKEAVLSHHENVDGSGYPNGTTGARQSLYTKILHVADVYDALVSKRPYKKPYSTNEAIEYMLGGCNILFDQKVVEALTREVAHYPRGHQMQLSDGRMCIVVDNQGKHTMRPIVRLLNGQTIDLCDKENLHLVLIDIESDSISIEYEEERRIMVGEKTKPTVVIVDDMRTNLDTLRTIFEEEYNVVLLKSGDQSISYVQSQGDHLPHIILMDVDMPGINGLEAARQINQLTNNAIPILFVTALNNRQTVLASRELGAAGYVLRPYQPVYIKSEVKRILTGIDYAL